MMPTVGSTARRTRTVSRRDIELFTQLTGDRNPLHHDEELAAGTRFGGLIVQGGVTSGLLNAVLDEDTGPFRHVVYAIGGGMLFGLHAFPDGDWSSGFDPRRPGLDHVAFTCGDRAELEHWQDRLEELGIKHGGIVDAHYGSGLSFKDPDGIALEFFAPPA